MLEEGVPTNRLSQVMWQQTCAVSAGPTCIVDEDIKGFMVLPQGLSKVPDTVKGREVRQVALYPST